MASLRPALKRLHADGRFTLLSTLTLAVGIGLSVAIFSLVHAVLLAPLPYPEPERLVVVTHEAPGMDLRDMDISLPLFLRYRDRRGALEELGLQREGRVSLTGLDRPDRVHQGTVSASLFRVAQVQPILGRSFDEDDEAPGAAPVALVSEGFWKGRLGADPEVLDRSVELDGTPRRIVGVLPETFDLPTENVEVWVPIVFDPTRQRLGQFSYICVARLRPGASVESALNELSAITSGIEQEFPEESAAPVLARAGFAPRVVPLLERKVGDLRSALLLLSGAVAFVLLMACVNVANVFLVRAEGRRRELALRAALGATRGRMLSEFLLEGVCVALAGGALGLFLARLALAALVRFAPEGLPRLSGIGLDASTLAFAFVISMGSAVFVALFPLLPYGRPDIVDALKEGGRGSSASRERVSLRKILVAGQMALGLLLLVGAGLMARSFGELSRVAPGFRAEGALSLRVSLPQTTYDSALRVAGFAARVAERLEAHPGVLAAGSVDDLPLSGSAHGAGHALEDFPLAEGDPPPVFYTHVANAGYRAAMGIPLLAGRWLTPADEERARPVAVVSESLARRYWPEGEAVGKRLAPGRRAENGWYEIVGVVSDVHEESLQVPPRETVYYPFTATDDVVPRGNVAFVIRTSLDPQELAAAAREAVWAEDPNVPITNVLTLETVVAQSRAPMAFSMTLLLLASLLAVLLGAIGIYGVVSIVVESRTKEIGVRVALGALRGQIRSLVLRDGLKTVLPGIALGLVAALATTRFMGSLLFVVSPLDPASFLVAPFVLLAVALVASLLPAERAARVDPLEALRRE